MNRRLESAKKGPAFWLIRKITFPVYFCVLLYLSVVVYARAPVPNLSGTWTFPDGTIITMVQQDRRIEGRISAPSPQAVTEGGWHSNDMVLEGVITQGKLVGKAHVRFPMSIGNNCPDEQVVVTDVELRIVNSFSLDGRHLAYVLHSSGCRVVAVGWARMALSRREFDITESAAEIGITVPDMVLFDFDSDKLKPRAIDVLHEIKSLIIDKQSFARVSIDGYTDDTGSSSYNKNLSTRRAQSVAHWLSSNGLDGNALETQGFGPTRPVVPNTSESNRSKNRRVEIRLIR
jgi:outer membrane protein OmpA-like peptidoglycan-associated protein